MKYARILLHSLLALAPVAAGAWGLQAFLDLGAEDVIGYGFALACLVLIVLVAAAWFPLLVLIAVRNIPYAPGDTPRVRKPIHPIGWITGIGGWALLGALIWVLFNRVTLSDAIGPLLVLLFGGSLILAWRYEERRDRAATGSAAPSR